MVNRAFPQELSQGTTKLLMNPGSLPSFRVVEPGTKLSSGMKVPGGKKFSALGGYYLIVQELSGQALHG